MKLPVHIFIELFFWNMLCYVPVLAIQHIRTGMPILPEELFGAFVIIMLATIIRERYRLKHKNEAFSSQKMLFLMVALSVSVMVMFLAVSSSAPAEKAYHDKIDDIATRVGNYFESITWLP